MSATRHRTSPLPRGAGYLSIAALSINPGIDVMGQERTLCVRDISEIRASPTYGRPGSGGPTVFL
jgi:hypothetical protein